MQQTIVNIVKLYWAYEKLIGSGIKIDCNLSSLQEIICRNITKEQFNKCSQGIMDHSNIDDHIIKMTSWFCCDSYSFTQHPTKHNVIDVKYFNTYLGRILVGDDTVSFYSSTFSKIFNSNIPALSSIQYTTEQFIEILKNTDILDKLKTERIGFQNSKEKDTIQRLVVGLQTIIVQNGLNRHEYYFPE